MFAKLVKEMQNTYSESQSTDNRKSANLVLESSLKQLSDGVKKELIEKTTISQNDTVSIEVHEDSRNRNDIMAGKSFLLVIRINGNPNNYRIIKNNDKIDVQEPTNWQSPEVGFALKKLIF